MIKKESEKFLCDNCDMKTCTNLNTGLCPSCYKEELAKFKLDKCYCGNDNIHTHE